MHVATQESLVWVPWEGRDAATSRASRISGPAVASIVLYKPGSPALLISLQSMDPR